MNRRELTLGAGAAVILGTPEFEAEAKQAAAIGMSRDDEWVTFWNSSDKDAELVIYWRKGDAIAHRIHVPKGGYVAIREQTANFIIAAEWHVPS